MQWWDGAAWGQVQETAAQQPSAMPPPPPGYGTPPPVGGYAPAPYAPAYPYAPQMPAVLQGRQLAGWWSRVGATLLDSLFIIFTLFIGFFVNWFLMARDGEKNGMTLGKQIVGQRVIREDGMPVDIGFAIVREFVVRFLLLNLVGGFFFGLPGFLDLLWPLWDDKNQALHDKIVKSYVVDA
jgi:uncharacterized RDD family membrane protein YckC